MREIVLYTGDQPVRFDVSLYALPASALLETRQTAALRGSVAYAYFDDPHVSKGIAYFVPVNGPFSARDRTSRPDFWKPISYSKGLLRLSSFFLKVTISKPLRAAVESHRPFPMPANRIEFKTKDVILTLRSQTS